MMDLVAMTIEYTGTRPLSILSMEGMSDVLITQ